MLESTNQAKQELLDNFTSSQKESFNLTQRIKSLEEDLEGVKAERDAHQEKNAAQKAVDDLKQQIAKLAELDNEKNEKTAKDDRLKALEQELNGVKAERDARNQEKNAAQKAVDDLSNKSPQNWLSWITRKMKDCKRRPSQGSRTRAKWR